MNHPHGFTRNSIYKWAKKSDRIGPLPNEYKPLSTIKPPVVASQLPLVQRLFHDGGAQWASGCGTMGFSGKPTSDG
jgi:hypothetical protein